MISMPDIDAVREHIASHIRNKPLLNIGISASSAHHHRTKTNPSRREVSNAITSTSGTKHRSGRRMPGPK